MDFVRHIYRERNVLADEAAKRSLEQKADFLQHFLAMAKAVAHRGICGFTLTGVIVTVLRQLDGSYWAHGIMRIIMGTKIQIESVLLRCFFIFSDHLATI